MCVASFQKRSSKGFIAPLGRPESLWYSLLSSYNKIDRERSNTRITHHNPPNMSKEELEANMERAYHRAECVLANINAIKSEIPPEDLSAALSSPGGLSAFALPSTGNGQSGSTVQSGPSASGPSGSSKQS